MKYKINLLLILGIICILLSIIPDIPQLISSNLPFDSTSNFFLTDSNDIIIANSTYSSIQKYSSNGEFLFGWKVMSLSISGMDVIHKDGILHVFYGRYIYGIYKQYTESGKLLKSKKLRFKDYRKLRSNLTNEKDKQYNIKRTIFFSSILSHPDSGKEIVIKPFWLLKLFAIPFPGLFYFVIGIIVFKIQNKNNVWKDWMKRFLKSMW